MIRVVVAAAALCALGACHRQPDRTQAAGKPPVSDQMQAQRESFVRFAQSRPALRAMLEKHAEQRRSLGTWRTPAPFWGSSFLTVTADSDNAVVMEVAEASGRVVAWARGTLASRTPPEGSLSSPPRALAPFAKWRVDSKGGVVTLVGLVPPGRSVTILQAASVPVSRVTPQSPAPR